MLRESFDANQSMVDPDVDQEGDPCVPGWRSAVVDFSGNSVQQPSVKANVFAHRRVADESMRDAVAAWDVVARVLKNDGGRPDATEVSDGADLRIHLNAMHIGQCFILVPVKTNALT